MLCAAVCVEKSDVPGALDAVGTAVDILCCRPFGLRDGLPLRPQLGNVAHDPYREPAPHPEVIPPSSVRWFVQRRRGARGPYTTADMRRKLRKGLLTLATIVRHDGTSSWRPLRAFPLLAPYRPLPSADRAPATEARPGALASWWMGQDELVRAVIVLIVMGIVFGVVIPRALMAIAWPNGPPAVHHHRW